VDNVTDGVAPLERAGLRNVRRTPALGVPLLMMALIGTLATRFRSGCRCWRATPFTAMPRR